MGKNKNSAKGGTSKQGNTAQKAGKQAKSAAVDISHKHASKIRELLQDVDEQDSAAGTKQSAQHLKDVYDALVGHAFQQADIRAAMVALKGQLTVDSALDWLCINVPPDRLPRRFAAGAHSHSSAASTRVVARATGAKTATPASTRSATEIKAEAARLQQQHAAQRAAAEESRREELARAQVENKARILAQYAAEDAGSEAASSGAASEIEDWELWGDPSQVERRRAERKRAAELNMLSEDERKQQLAVELKTALDQAKTAKASGDKSHKRVAGEVIRQLKLEIAAAGFKEPEIQAIIADMRRAEAPVIEMAPAPPAAEDVSQGADAHASGAADEESDAVALEIEPASGTYSGHGVAVTWEDEVPAAVPNGRSGADAADDSSERPAGKDAANGKAEPSAKSSECEFDAGALWDDDGSAPPLLDMDTLRASGAAGTGGQALDLTALAAVPLRTVRKKERPPPPELPLCVPKATLQQMCHKQNPPWAAPRFNKVSRTGESYRYSCTIVFPKPRFKKKKGNDGGMAPGPRTWQLLEAQDGFEGIQDAQNAVALRALLELQPDLLESYRLEPPLMALWQLWTEAGTGGAEDKAEGDAHADFIDSLLDQDQEEHHRAADAAASTADAGGDPSADLDAMKRRSGNTVSPAQEAAESERLHKEQLAFQESPTGREWTAKREQLPVLQVRGALLDALARGDACVLSGDTGCGKTTQVPQYILESEIAAGRGAKCQIVCTQPRRLAAISVAERVAVERAEPPPGKRGSKLGYHVRLDPAISPDTRLSFVTTGILLRRLAADPMLEDVSHVIVDEVHERSMQGDFLLALLRRLLTSRRMHGARPLKIVLMSATIDLNLLCDYFGGCPRMSARGRTFPVEQYFLEDVYEMTSYRLEDQSAAAIRNHRDRSFQAQAQKQAGKQARLVKEGWGDDEIIQTDALNPYYDSQHYRGYSKHVHTNIARLDENAIDFDLMEDLVRYIDATQDEGAILVFLPGMGEITNLADRLNGSHHFQQGKHWVIPLHSTVAPEDQKQAFVRPPRGVRKVVISTNIAETSLTIEDVVYVVDSGKLKERRFAASRGVSMLVLDSVSQASARQRKGRAGRVREGKCYSLFTRPAHERMPRFQIPEIMRVPLEELVLQIHLLELGTAESFLSELLQPPPEKAIVAAIQSLRVIGALHAEGEEALTALGTHLAKLPVEPRLGKLLVTSVFMGCIGDALTIAACLSYKPPFSTAFAAAEAADLAKRHLASEQSNCIASSQQSDHLVMLAAYNGWRAAFEKGGARLARDYVKRHCLSYVTLQMLRDMRVQFASMLADIRLIGHAREGGREGGGRAGLMARVDDPSTPWNVHCGRGPVIIAALTAALYPQIACMDGSSNSSARPVWFDAASLVAIHKASVLHPLLTRQFNAPYLAYSEKMQTGSTFLREVSVVSPIALLLFGGSIEVHHDSGYVLLDGNLKIQVAAQTAVLVKKLRAAWASMMDDKVKRPQEPFTDTQTRILETIVSLVSEAMAR